MAWKLRWHWYTNFPFSLHIWQAPSRTNDIVLHLLNGTCFTPRFWLFSSAMDSRFYCSTASDISSWPPIPLFLDAIIMIIIIPPYNQSISLDQHWICCRETDKLNTDKTLRFFDWWLWYLYNWSIIGWDTMIIDLQSHEIKSWGKYLRKVKFLYISQQRYAVLLS